MTDRPEIPQDEFNKPLSKGGELPPLPLLPDREWLNALIVDVDFRYAMFNGQIQYVTRTEVDPATGQEIDIAVTDDQGEKICRKEFNIKFELADYTLPNNKGPRCCWLTMGASMGDKAHLPQFLFNVIGKDFEPTCPTDIIRALTGKAVRMQLKNKPNKKDPTRPPYQNVIYDAVEGIDKPAATAAPGPINQGDIPF